MPSTEQGSRRCYLIFCRPKRLTIEKTSLTFLCSRAGWRTRLDWIRADEAVAHFAVGLFGASTGAAAALTAAARRPDEVSAVVSRGGRPDLAADTLARVKAPTLLIVGGRDEVVIELNEKAMAKLNCEKRFDIVPGATHLFEEPGTLDVVISLASAWFLRFLGRGQKS